MFVSYLWQCYLQCSCSHVQYLISVYRTRFIRYVFYHCSYLLESLPTYFCWTFHYAWKKSVKYIVYLYLAFLSLLLPSPEDGGKEEQKRDTGILFILSIYPQFYSYILLLLPSLF